MKSLINKLKSISKVQLFAIILIIVGLSIMIPKGLGMFEFYKEVQYATNNNFQAGNPSPNLLRPWMSIRYISVAYAVPQKYLFEAANIQPKEENSMIALNRLNNQMKLGKLNGEPTLIKTIRDAIIAYRASPVVTGLIERKVSDWMNVQYIANSTGIPAETIFQEIGIPMDGNAYLPLGYLSDTVNYTGGSKALVSALQKIVDSQAVQPVQP
jgi:hypothetical protein